MTPNFSLFALAVVVVTTTMMMTVLVTATPTTPFSINTTETIPLQYLVRVRNDSTPSGGLMEVRNHGCPAKGSKEGSSSSKVRQGILGMTDLVNSGVYSSYYSDCHELATIRYNASNLDLGWDFTHVTTSNGTSWYDAGYIEGFVTAQSIENVLEESGVPQLGDANLTQWVDDHIAYMRANAEKLGSGDDFWATVGKLLSQIQGLTDGFNNATIANRTNPPRRSSSSKEPASSLLTFRDMFLISFQLEIGDVQTHLQLKARGIQATQHHLRRTLSAKDGHCSAIVKPTDNDLFVAHATWEGYEKMAFRAYKVYDFNGTTVTMSSYPAQIASGDDWYRTSNELAVQETTNFVWNASLFTAVVPETVSEFLRVMTANYLATSGRQWMEYFATENSGTENNQYMVVDFKRYHPNPLTVPPLHRRHSGSTFKAQQDRFDDGLLWVGEQIPGFVQKADQTHHLRTVGYWASYNIAFYPYIYNVSGYQENRDVYGSLFSYKKYARPQIFKRNQSAVTDDVSTLMRLMRFNNWRDDPLSVIPDCRGTLFNDTCRPSHSALLSIASRGDLMPFCDNRTTMRDHYGPISGPWVVMPCFGALDAKIASYQTRKQLTGLTIGGPTNDQQPTFAWMESNCNRAAPKNSPPRFDFPWIEWLL